MTEVIQFAVLGLGAGAIYALLAQGVVLIYRTSGILNFAQGAMAMAGAFVFYELYVKSGWAYVPSMLVAIISVGLLGAAVYRVVMRPLRHASPLARVIATLGVLSILTTVATMRYKGNFFIVPERLPNSVVQVGSIAVPQDRLWLLGIAIGFTVVLTLFFRRTRVGLATLAVAESPSKAAAMGWSVDRLAAASWAAGGALAAAAGVLVSPLVSLSSTSLTWMIIPALAAGLLAGFTSYSRALLGGLVIGILQSLSTRYISVQGASDAVPFLVIVAVLVVRGSSLTLRSNLIERLPRLGDGRLRREVLIPAAALALVAALILPQEWSIALGVSAVSATILLSIVVLTGYAGQLSLGQYALAGLGAMIAGQLVANSGWSFAPALAIGVLAATAVGVLFGLPSLRARGINLAIVTLGLGLAIQSAVLTNTSYSGGIDGLDSGSPSFFGFKIDPIEHPRNYTLFALAVLAVTGWIVSNLRRSRAGRRLIAVRTNERAASSLGVNVFAAKLYAFMVAAAIAGLGGVVLAFGGASVLVSEGFDPVASIIAVSLVVVGGVGFILGGVLGSTLVAGGLPGGVIANHIGNGQEWLTLIGAVALIVILIQDPDGMASNVSKLFAKLRRTDDEITRRESASKTLAAAADGASGQTAPAATLDVTGLTVRFGGVVAVNEVDLQVRTGEVVGLIGPNGAGKTTFVDAVTGFVSPSEGTISLDGTKVNGWSSHRRARAGLTRSFQSLELFDDLTVLDNLRAASDARDLGSYASGLVHPGQQPLPPSAVAAIRAFELEDDLHRRPTELSYGRRRLVAIARAVAASPSLLLLDEPAAGLGRNETQELGELIARLTREWKIGVLLIEHDVSVVMSICDRVAVLDFGRKIADAAPAIVRDDPQVRAAYLGEEADEPAPAPVATATEALS